MGQKYAGLCIRMGAWLNNEETSARDLGRPGPVELAGDVMATGMLAWMRGARPSSQVSRW